MTDKGDRLDQYTEIIVPLHNVALAKLNEVAFEYRLEPYSFYEQILLRVWENAEFRSCSNRLVESGRHRNMYAPGGRHVAAVIFSTQFAEHEALCQELLTSYAIGLLHKPELSQRRDLTDEEKLAAMV